MGSLVIATPAADSTAVQQVETIRKSEVLRPAWLVHGAVAVGVRAALVDKRCQSEPGWS